MYRAVQPRAPRDRRGQSFGFRIEAHVVRENGVA